MGYEIDPRDKKVMAILLSRAPGTTAEVLYDINKSRTSSQKTHEILQAAHRANFPPFSLEFYSEEQTVTMCYVTTGPAQLTLGRFFNAINPYFQVREIPDYLDNLSEEGMFAVGDFHYGNWEIYPSGDYKPIIASPTQPVLQAIAQVPPKFKVVTQFCIMPVHNSVRLHCYLWFMRQLDKIRHYLTPKYWFKLGVRKIQVESILDKTNRKLTITNLRIGVFLEGPEGAKGGKALQREMRHYLDQILVGYSLQGIPDLNWYKFHSVRFGRKYVEDMAKRRITRRPPAVLISLQELGGWFAFRDFSEANFRRVLSREYAPPTDLPSPETERERSSLSFFGKTVYRNQEMPFGILREDRGKHLLIVGAPQTGKANLLSILIKEDFEHGCGVGVIDPGGGLTERILELVPRERVDDVIIFDPSDREFPASLNPFDLVEDQSRMRVAAGLLEVFKERFSDLWSEKVEFLLLQVVLAMLSTQWTTVLAMKKLLLDPDYREEVVPNINDLVVRKFWQKNFPFWEVNHREDVIEPILLMVDNIVSGDMIKNCIGQPVNKFDFREIIDSGKILLVKITQRSLGANNAALLGSMIVTRIYQAAISRADIPFERRRDFYLYIDSFDEFATSSFDEILSESRKYRLNMTLSSKNISLLPVSLRNSVFSNVGSILSFRSTAEDAPILAEEFMPKIDTVDLTGLPKNHFYMKMLIRSRMERVFSGRTIELAPPEESYVNECISRSREKYALPKAQAEEIIKGWSKVG